jgi:hypothetical protein
MLLTRAGIGLGPVEFEPPKRIQAALTWPQKGKVPAGRPAGVRGHGTMRSWRLSVTQSALIENRLVWRKSSPVRIRTTALSSGG